VLLARIHKRGRSEEKPIRADYVAEVAQAYSRYFFDYSESPLLIVNASEIDFANNADDRAALIAEVRKTRAGVSHWSRS
jgi:deoxyguanosine kinase